MHRFISLSPTPSIHIFLILNAPRRLCLPAAERLSRLTISLCQYIYRENSQSALAWLTVSIVLRLPFLSLPQQLLQLPATAPTPAVGVADKDVLPSHWQQPLSNSICLLLPPFPFFCGAVCSVNRVSFAAVCRRLITAKRRD